MTASLFDRIRWCDPVLGRPLVPVVTARTPAGVPLCGALQIEGTREAYPIVDCVARLTPESAWRHRAWLAPMGLEPPTTDASRGLQAEATVDSFGFQWGWNSAMRTDADLQWRTAERFGVGPDVFAGKLVLDAGAGAGDQSRWLLDAGADVVSVDLSGAIEVVAAKLRLRGNWFGVQGDITALPLSDDQFGVVYCEGVIQHTRDSGQAVRELCRVVTPGGLVLATHYGKAQRLRGHLRLGLISSLRRHLSRLDRYRLLWLTGNLAALAYLPLVGRLLRLSGVAAFQQTMPDFKTTWTNTFDCYGNHHFQRHIEPEAFAAHFEQAHMQIEHQEHTLVMARRPSRAPGEA